MVESLVGAIENYLSQEALLKGLFDIARILAENTCQMERSRRFARDYIVAMKIQGQAALGMGNITQADELLHNALKLVRSANLIEEEISIVITVSEIKRRQGDINSARNFLIEIQDFLKRAPYPSFHADTLNILAQIERDEGHTAAAIAAATQAYEKAWCDGPPYAYHWGLEVARKHLDELGAPYPSMPPFDPSKYEPMPEVEINPPDEFHV